MLPSSSLKQVNGFSSRHANVVLLFFFALLVLRTQVRFVSTPSFNGDESVLQDLKSLAMVNCSTVQDCIATLQENAKLQKEKEKADESMLQDSKFAATVNCSTVKDCIVTLQEDSKLRKEKEKRDESVLQDLKSLAANCSAVHDCIAALKEDMQIQKEKEIAQKFVMEEAQKYRDLKSLFEVTRQLFNCNNVQACIATLQKDTQFRQAKEKAYNSVLKDVTSLAVKRSKIPQGTLFPIPNVNTIHILQPRTKPHGIPQAIWNDTFFPDFYIAGLGKAGSSHLQKVLESHRDVRSLFQFEEVCSGVKVDYIANSKFSNDEKLKIQQQLYDFHFTRFEDAKRSKQLYPSKSKTVSTCFKPLDIILRHDYLMTTKKSRIFFLLRDPADWLWAAYNFWARSKIMDHRTNVFNQWAHPKYEYRSPEHFHEIMAAGNKSVIGAAYLARAEMTVQPLRYLKAAFGKDYLFVVRSEDMKPQNNFIGHRQQPEGLFSFFDKLVSFTGLSRDGFQNETVNSFHNCNDKKGKEQICNAKTAKIGYSISGNRDMLEETRKLIYLYFHEECKIWKEEFDVEYPDCLNAL